MKFVEILKNNKSKNINIPQDTYDIYPEECFQIDGVYCSNTAELDENPKGERTTPIYLKNKKNIVINGNNSILRIHGIVTPFVLLDNMNITIKNFEIEYVRPTMSEFLVLESNEKETIVKINETSLYEIKDNKLYWISEKSKTGGLYWVYPYKEAYMLSTKYDLETKRLRMMDRYNPTDRFPSVPTIKTIEEIEPFKLKMSFTEKCALPVNNVISTRNVKRIQNGGVFSGNENIKLQNITIRFSNGMGLVFQDSKNIVIDKVNYISQDNRIVTSNADFYHFSGCKGKIIIKNCQSGGAHDDVVNVHGTHLRVIDFKDNEVTLRFMHPQSFGFRNFLEGEFIEFINGQTLVPIYKDRIRKVEQINLYNIKLTLQNPVISTIRKDVDVVENVSKTARLVVKNNYFYNIISRGVLATTRKKVVIKNNTFKDIGGNALLIADDCNFWYESGRAGMIIFKNNRLINADYGMSGTQSAIINVNPVVLDKESAQFVHDKLVYKNNTVLNGVGDKYLINLNYIKSVIIKNNIMDKPYQISSNIVGKIVEK